MAEEQTTTAVGERIGMEAGMEVETAIEAEGEAGQTATEGQRWAETWWIERLRIRWLNTVLYVAGWEMYWVSATIGPGSLSKTSGAATGRQHAKLCKLRALDRSSRLGKVPGQVWSGLVWRRRTCRVSLASEHEWHDSRYFERLLAESHTGSS